MKLLNRTDAFEYYQLDSGAKLVRHMRLSDALNCDIIYPNGLGYNDGRWGNDEGRMNYKRRRAQAYIEKRRILSNYKQRLIVKARKELSIDKEFLELVYKAKSAKRTYVPNKHGGVLSMPAYVTNSKDVFLKRKPGAKKVTIDMAFQVGRLSGENYEDGFVAILKTILMAQALNINLNIDMFDSDTAAITGGPSYTLIRVANSRKKLNMNDILLCSHSEFFDITLFNSYSASGNTNRIGTFLGGSRIKRDLGAMYDVIGGNMLIEDEDTKGTISHIMKIAGL